LNASYGDKRLFTSLGAGARCFHPSGAFIKFGAEDIEQSIPARFEKIVRSYPLHLAVKTNDPSLTYSELNGEANRIAQAIMAKRGTRNECIARFIEEGIDLIAAMLGALKRRSFLGWRR